MISCLHNLVLIRKFLWYLCWICYCLFVWFFFFPLQRLMDDFSILRRRYLYKILSTGKHWLRLVNLGMFYSSFYFEVTSLFQYTRFIYFIFPSMDFNLAQAVIIYEKLLGGQKLDLFGPCICPPNWLCFNHAYSFISWKKAWMACLIASQG